MPNFQTKIIFDLLREAPILPLTEAQVLALFQPHFSFLQQAHVLINNRYLFHAKLFDHALTVEQAKGLERGDYLDFKVEYADFDFEGVLLHPTAGELIKKHIPDRVRQREAIYGWFESFFEMLRVRQYQQVYLYVLDADQKDLGFYTKEPMNFRATGSFVNTHQQFKRRL